MRRGILKRAIDGLVAFVVDYVCPHAWSFDQRLPGPGVRYRCHHCGRIRVVKG